MTRPTPRLLPLAAIACVVSACSAGLDVPEGADIVCGSSNECPSDYTCVVAIGRCAPSRSNDGTPPTVTSSAIEPAVIGAEGRVEVTLGVSEPLLSTPRLVARLPNGDFELTYNATRSDPAALRYVFNYQHEAEHGSGTATIGAAFADRAGQLAALDLGTFLVDAVGPSVSAALLIVDQRALGTPDTVRGLPGALEVGSVVEVATDAAFLELVAISLADPSGGFSFLAIGDNGVNQQAGVTSGQGTYYLRGRDTIGNTGATIDIAVDVSPPALTASVIERELDDPLTVDTDYIATATVSQVPWRVSLDVDADLAELPVVEVDTAPPITLPCVRDGTIATHYTCVYAEADPLPESIAFSMYAILVEDGTENVAKAFIGDITYDGTVPAPVDFSKTVVQQNPTGTNDRLVLSAGAVEANAVVMVYTKQVLNGGGPLFCNNILVASGQADATGALDLDLGDNQAGLGARVRVADAAGNDACATCQPFQDCDGSQRLGNDTIAPELSTIELPTLTRLTELPVYFTTREVGEQSASGAANTHDPVTIYCAVDGGAPVPCPLVHNLMFDPGIHHFAYYAEDGLLNRSNPVDTTIEIANQQVLLDAPAYADLSPRGYVTGPGNLGFAALGGDLLRAVREGPAGTFAVDVLSDVPVARTAVSWGNDRYIAYSLLATGNVQQRALFFLAYNAGAWDQSLVALDGMKGEAFDMAVSATGTVAIAHQYCTVASDGCFANGPDLDKFGVRLSIRQPDGSFTHEEVPSAHKAYSPTIAFDATGDLWVAFHEVADGIYLQKRSASNGWETAIKVVGTGVAVPLLEAAEAHQALPKMVLDAAGRPAVAYIARSSGAQGGRVYLATTTNLASFTFDLLAGSRSWAMARSPEGEIWVAFPDGNINRRAGGTLTSSTLPVSQSNSVSLAVPLGGALTVATVHRVTLEARGGRSVQPERLRHASGSDTLAELTAPSSVIALGGRANAAAPALIVGNPTGPLTPFGLSGDTFAAGTAIALGGIGFGHGAQGVEAGGVTWIVHQRFTPTFNSTVHVVSNGGGSFVDSADLSPDTEQVSHVAIDIAPSGQPVVAYVRETNSPSAVMVTFRKAGAWVTPFVVRSGFSFGGPVNGLQVIGDANGATAGGETWVTMSAEGDAIVARFDTATENTTNATCETCTYDVRRQDKVNMWVGSKRAPNGSIDFLVAHADEPLVRHTFTTAWAESSIADAMVLMQHAANGAWVDGPACVPLPILSEIRLGHTSTGALRFAAWMSCGGRTGYAYVRQTGTTYRVYFVSGATVTGSWAPEPPVVIMQGDVGTVAWIESASEDAIAQTEARLGL